MPQPVAPQPVHGAGGFAGSGAAQQDDGGRGFGDKLNNVVLFRGKLEREVHLDMGISVRWSGLTGRGLFGVAGGNEANETNQLVLLVLMDRSITNHREGGMMTTDFYFVQRRESGNDNWDVNESR
ncbi:hypothetical protein Vafri_12403 [Volvox africanus]|uniref:Uncharacterized protein n=1 Tax=Volvox africanus TaxID=51714 RepID=A0A8J4BA95_9CHLO|nr:hypothetical protein Vafri_12403 [Volvox africanus]